MPHQRSPISTLADTMSSIGISVYRDPCIGFREFALTNAALASRGRKTVNRKEAGPVRSTLKQPAASEAFMGPASRPERRAWSRSRPKTLRPRCGRPAPEVFLDPRDITEVTILVRRDAPMPNMEVRNAVFRPARSGGTLLSISLASKSLRPRAIPMNVPRIPRTVVADCENLRAFLFQKANTRQIAKHASITTQKTCVSRSGSLAGETTG